jgi:hypothetical protein
VKPPMLNRIMPNTDKEEVELTVEGKPATKDFSNKKQGKNTKII